MSFFSSIHSFRSVCCDAFKLSTVSCSDFAYFLVVDHLFAAAVHDNAKFRDAKVQMIPLKHFSLTVAGQILFIY